jgi:hypothetical protein
MRAAEEQRSAQIFEAAAAAAASIGEARLAEVLEGVARDEQRHVALCVEVGDALGAAPPAFDDAPVEQRLGALPTARRRLASLLLVEAAIGETISSALFRAGRRATTEPCAHGALTAILTDEIRHARIGWEALRDLWPRLDAVERDRLRDDAAAALGGLEQQIALPALQRIEAATPFDPSCAAQGVLSPEARVEAFYDALERHVLPRLTALGIDGDHAWSTRYLPTAARTGT